MSRYLAASISLSDGRVLRIGPDEDQVGDIPLRFSFQTQIPGGFGPASLTIARPPDLYADDARLFSEVSVYGEGMRIIYEGFVIGLPQQSQDEIQLELAGWSTILDRISSFRQIFVNRDLTSWRDPTGPRQLRNLELQLARSVGGPSIGNDSQNRPVLTLQTSESANVHDAEAWFDAGPGLNITKLYFSEASGIFGANSQLFVAFTDDPVNGAPRSGAGPANLGEQPILIDNRVERTFVAATPSRYAYFRHQGGPNWGVPYYHSIRDLTVIGNHNVPLTGPQPGGVYGSEAIAYMVGPTVLSLEPGSVEPSDFVIPHLSFTADVSLREAIEQINVLGGVNRTPNDWGVYENRGFFWRSPGTYGKTWNVKAENLSNVRSDGPDSALRTSGVKVNYQDETGLTKSVGPPNSYADFETPTLLSIDPNNPAFRLPGFHTENIGLTSTQGAINVGKVILNERNRLNWRGDIELQGEVFDAEGKPYPVHRVRAGDQVVVIDDDDTKPRPVNSTTYNHENLSLTASLGAVPNTLDSLLARLAAVTNLFV